MRYAVHAMPSLDGDDDYEAAVRQAIAPRGGFRVANASNAKMRGITLSLWLLIGE